MKAVIFRIEFERLPEFVNVGISFGNLFAREFGSPGFPAADAASSADIMLSESPRAMQCLAN